MTICFSPPQLEAARHSATLRQVASEWIDSSIRAELRVSNTFESACTRLVYVRDGQPPVSLDLPRNWLYSELTEADLRARLGSIFRHEGRGAARLGSN